MLINSVPKRFLNHKLELVIALCLLLALVIAIFSHGNLKRNLLTDQIKEQTIRLDKHQQSLQATLNRYDYLPFVLSKNHQLFNLAFTDVMAANQLLAEIQQETLADAIYILRADGLTIASSNWAEAGSFVGNNYNYRPYFQQAIKSGRGHFFGVGITTGVPGYFVSARYPTTGQLKAVIVAKINQDVFEANWSQNQEMTFVSDENGVILLSSNDNWLYHSLEPLDATQLAGITTQRQFGSTAPSQLNIDHLTGSNDILTIDSVPYVHTVANLDEVNWRIHHLTPYQQIRKQLFTFWTQLLSIGIAALALFLYFRIRHVRRALRNSQGESSKLRELNTSLENEIIERKQVEANLRKAEADLRRTGKLTAMGQLSASVSHELNQPLSAMKAYISSILPDEASTNIAIEAELAHNRSTVTKLSALVDRMIRITHQLRYFARSGDKELRRIDLQQVIEGALSVTKPAIEQAAVEFIMDKPNDSIWVMAGEVRLEQVLVNLIRNALDAMSDLSKDDHQLALTLSTNTDSAQFVISDTGPGLEPEVLEHLFEPFYSTKPSGVGMGLGLAISTNIVAEVSGSLRAENNASGGATFIITLPLANTDTNEGEKRNG